MFVVAVQHDFTISTQSLDMVIATRQVQDRGTNQAPILGPANQTYKQQQLIMHNLKLDQII
jgi:hypothetical protein